MENQKTGKQKTGKLELENWKTRKLEKWKTGKMERKKKH